jgi:hypothetical protein
MMFASRGTPCRSLEVLWRRLGVLWRCLDIMSGSLEALYRWLAAMFDCLEVLFFYLDSTLITLCADFSFRRPKPAKPSPPPPGGTRPRGQPPLQRLAQFVET